MNSMLAADIFGADRDREGRITLELESLRVKQEARRLLDAESRPAAPIPPFETLREWLAEPDQPLTYRIDGWMPEGANTMLPAQFKSGKTTLRNNYLRSIVDGDLWLGRYDVTPIDGTVLVLDFEMTKRQGKTWLRDAGIRRTGHVVLVSLRGCAAAFNILDERVRHEWAVLAKQHGVVSVVLDCLRPAMDALVLDEHKDGGRFLLAFDAFKQEAGIAESLVIHHMGHSGERSRGDSRFRDWPDVEWRLVRQDDDPASPRFITAFGRDVDVPESQLEYEACTRRLTIAGGSRTDVKSERVLDAITEALRSAAEKMTGRAIKGALAGSDYSRDEIDAALAFARRTDRLSFEQGKNNSILYWVSGVRAVSGQCPADSESGVRVSGPFIRAGRQDTHGRPTDERL